MRVQGESYYEGKVKVIMRVQGESYYEGTSESYYEGTR